MKKRLWGLWLCLAALLIPTLAQADIPITTYSGTISSATAGQPLALVGQSTCAVVLSGTWSGTVTFQGSSDNGVTWNTVTAINTTGTATGQTVVNTSSTSVTGTVVGLSVATGTATLLFNCTGT